MHSAYQTTDLGQSLINSALVPLEQIESFTGCPAGHGEAVHAGTSQLLQRAAALHLLPDRDQQVLAMLRRAAQQKGWTDEKKLLAVYLVTLGQKSRGQAAIKLGRLKRDMVVGKLRRLGIKGPEPAPKS